MTAWRLRRVRQCLKCPWRVATDPHDIPNGYTEERHRALRSTIASDPLSSLRGALHVMACHESHEAHCIGWLVNQLEQGNNIALRLHIRDCTNAHAIKLRGPQHETFDATLPKPGRKPPPA